MPPLDPAAARTFVVPGSPWLGWALLAGAVLFAAGLSVLLVVIARRSRWHR